MPFLGGLLVNLMGGLVGLLGAFMAQRVALAAAAVVASAALLGVLTAAITGALGAVLLAMPVHPMVSTGLYFGVPDNGPLVMAFCLMVDASLAVYRLGTEKIWMAIST